MDELKRTFPSVEFMLFKGTIVQDLNNLQLLILSLPKKRLHHLFAR